MANRTKTDRNKRILKLWDNGKGWRQVSIAKMMHMTVGAVTQVIFRARRANEKADCLAEIVIYI